MPSLAWSHDLAIPSSLSVANHQGYDSFDSYPCFATDRSQRHKLQDYGRRSPYPSPKAKDHVGGVAVVLDYEMEDMVHFVTVTSQAMYDLFASSLHLDDIDMDRSVFKSSPIPESNFQAFVTRLLTCTRLPSSTILLALYYLSKRLTQLSRHGYAGRSQQDMHQVLTVALMLASKFLDDNTFQNRAWAEISELPVQELNSAEVRWLVDIRWNLYFDQTPKAGFFLWTSHWKRFESQRQEYGAPQLWRDVQRHAVDSPFSGATPQFGPIGHSPSRSLVSSGTASPQPSGWAAAPYSGPDVRQSWLQYTSFMPAVRAPLYGTLAQPSFLPRLSTSHHHSICRCAICDRAYGLNISQPMPLMAG